MCITMVFLEGNYRTFQCSQRDKNQLKSRQMLVLSGTVKIKCFETPNVAATRLQPVLVFRNTRIWSFETSRWCFKNQYLVFPNTKPELLTTIARFLNHQIGVSNIHCWWLRNFKVVFENHSLVFPYTRSEFLTTIDRFLNCQVGVSDSHCWWLRTLFWSFETPKVTFRKTTLIF